ncbi:MAG TPA: PQQ-binding-like beta-propeller repeat protein [Verrucomicrobiales bacterium]|nr:PQQ-binding-like beta-propeller repeat protein [Verrucomicrobiales bacterium]
MHGRSGGWGRMVGLVLAAPGCLWAAAGTNWDAYLGDSASSQHSTLTQIDRDNVHRLEVAWIYRSGDARDEGRSQVQCNPLVIDGVLYGSSAGLKLFALDARSGKELWRFDPFEGKEPVGVNRGMVHWGKGEEGRILYTAGTWLYAVDARNGRLLESFGTGGRVDLREGLGRPAQDLFVLANTPGVVFDDLLILGTRVGEGPGPSAPGHMRAYDLRSGEIRWTFRTIPEPGDFGYRTWPPEAWKTAGGCNTWSGMSVDHERGLVFVPTGSAAFDFWGGNRHGANLFANCVIALRADSGELVWHYQIVHHDLWDRDLPAPPNLVRVVHDGVEIDAVAQVTKSGHVFLLDRDLGQPLFPVVERPVPSSDLAGEQAWPTQPLPLAPPPFARQVFDEDTATDLTPASREAVLAKLREVRTGRQFIPPSTVGTVVFPGFDGGAEWGGAAFDPGSGRLIVNSNEMPWILTMIETGSATGGDVSGESVYRLYCAACHGLDRKGDPARAIPPVDTIAPKLNREQTSELLETGRGVMPSFGFLSQKEKELLLDALIAGPQAETGAGPERAPNLEGETPEAGTSPYTHTGYNRFFDPEGYPAVKPPWGTLNAVNLNTGAIDWSVPLGEFEELTRRGVPQTGTENYGGPVVTEGGLIFIGASQDAKFRAFDRDNGRVLWETQLPAGGYATPATYSVDGVQYVVIAAGGGKMGTPSGDAYLAFRLPLGATGKSEDGR